MKERTCHRLDGQTVHLRDRYRRLALVMERSHVEAVGESDDTLLVSSNWLLWQQCLDEGRHCVHIDRGVLGWDALKLGDSHYLDIQDWVYVDGVDATLFKGVSLGRKFLNETSLVMADYVKLRHSLEALIDEFGPKEILFHDLRTDYGYLDREERLHILREVAAERSLRIADPEDTSDSSESDFPTIQSFSFLVENRFSLKSLLKSAVLVVFERFFNLLSICIRSLAPGRPAVLILATSMNSVPLLENFDGKGIFPLFLASMFPNKWNFRRLIDYLKKGGMLVSAGRPKLQSRDRAAANEMERRLEAAWETPVGSAEGALRRHVRKNVLGKYKFYNVAADVLWAERLLERHKPDQIFTDGFMGPIPTTFLELAQARGIRTAAVWHAPYIQNVRIEALGSNPKYAPLIDRLFTWGKAQEDWFDVISAKAEKIRTGSPISGQHHFPGVSSGKPKKVLILQYFLSYNDFLSPACHEYYFFVRTIRMLESLGFSEIRLKFHPGLKKIPYYRRISKYFGIECDFRDSGPFKDHVDWADFAIGPPTSGSMLEVIGAGKPHYPVLLSPNSANLSLLEGCHIFHDFESLGNALKDGFVPNHREFLNNFISYNEIDNPARHVWDALRKTLPD